jgi:hypothetical protein
LVNVLTATLFFVAFIMSIITNLRAFRKSRR